jgi:hypothetical protein
LALTSPTSGGHSVGIVRLRTEAKEFVLFCFFVCRQTRRPPLWSSGQEFLATDPEARVRFSALPGKKVVGLERGPLSLASTTEELLDRKVAAPV